MGAPKEGGFKGRRNSTAIMPVACRIVNCDGEGYGRYCHKHVPAKGAGVLRCDMCKKPLATHAITKPCIPR